MKADDHGPAAGFQAPGQIGQESLQAAKLIVDGDAESLESSGGRVDGVALVLQITARCEGWTNMSIPKRSLDRFRRAIRALRSSDQPR